MNPRWLVRVGHSPDPDDAFMFYALATGKLETGRVRLEHLLEGIETLNRWALEARLEVTAISVHAYAYVADRYLLLPHGASVGRQYGPIVVAKSTLDRSRLGDTRIAVPGTLTTAYLLLRLYLPGFRAIVFPFDRIFDAVEAGEADAGLVIHEGQLTYTERGFVKLVDLGAWWHDETGLPLPLGANAIRRDLEPSCSREVSRLLRASIDYALTHRDEALQYALQFGRGMLPALADRFVTMYVNEDTRAWSPEARRGLERLLDLAWRQRVIPRRLLPEFLPA
jgi:1,4-dihydroxy-6-naphthoate synthase